MGRLRVKYLKMTGLRVKCLMMTGLRVVLEGDSVGMVNLIPGCLY